ncbi:MAG TPA: carbamoyltransferase [Bacteroidales bacterium]|nr:carbamoyltransferase [Bacteroidales bacterium]
MPDAILGISAFYHDSAAALVVDGRIIAAAQEERFTRRKHDPGFPRHAVSYVLREGGIPYDELSAVVFYDKPFLKFERLLETYHAFAPKGYRSFLTSIPVWIKEKMFMKRMLREELAQFGTGKVPLLFPEHHLSHAASAFYPSPFQEAAILTIDGVGEWATTTIGHGQGRDIRILRELHFPHSVGLLYSAFTWYLGFRVNSGEYKLMGLAPYGLAQDPQTKAFADIIRRELCDIREDGSLLLNMRYFRFATGLRMCDDRRWTDLFGMPPRKESDPLRQDHMNLALAIQQVTEEIVLLLAATARRLTGSSNLVMAGGVALNSVANGKLLQSGIFDGFWIQPAAGDAGGALGAALLGGHLWEGRDRRPQQPDAMNAALLGPSFPPEETESLLRRYGAQAKKFEEFNELARTVAQKIADGAVVGWFQGRMEFGPRALGNRSILGDARNPGMQKKMNLKIKYREGFRPFAPSVPEEDVARYFELSTPSPYMLLVVPVDRQRCIPLPEGYDRKELYERLYFGRSDIPAVTHIDYSARLQSVNRRDNPRYWQVMKEMERLTGTSVIVNTSFNVRGEPIVCTPDDAFRCFMRTEMDFLVIGDYLFDKASQAHLAGDPRFGEVFGPD